MEETQTPLFNQCKTTHTDTDLLVIGGGINGAGIARDAAGRGLRVTLCEKDDLAQGTSSRSGKLVHGGLRYLEYYEFRLVREALIEREVLLRSAPHIIWPLRFVLPHSKHDRPAWLLRLGLFLYDHLGGRKMLPGTRTLNLRTCPEGDALATEFKKGFEFSDCWADDARLVVLCALDAHERGATILPHTRFVHAIRDSADNGIWQATLKRANGEIQKLTAKAIVNAAGPWVNQVIDDVPDATSNRRVRLVKGSHIVVPKFWDGPHAYLVQNSDKRVIFINPYETDYALIGTTDIPQNGAPESAQISAEEASYLLDTVNRYFKSSLQTDDIVESFSGVRPLYDDNAENPSAVTRDYVFDIDGEAPAADNTTTHKATPVSNDQPATKAPLLSVFGGKITTFRKLAEHALEQLQPWFPSMEQAWTVDATLPGGSIENADFEAFTSDMAKRFPWLNVQTNRHLCRLYGDRMERIIANATEESQLGLKFAANFYEAEARYLLTCEWAASAQDILQRRTKHGLHLSRAEKSLFENWCSVYARDSNLYTQLPHSRQTDQRHEVS